MRRASALDCGRRMPAPHPATSRVTRMIPSCTSVPSPVSPGSRPAGAGWGRREACVRRDGGITRVDPRGKSSRWSIYPSRLPLDGAAKRMYTRERLQNPFRSRCEVVFGPLRGVPRTVAGPWRRARMRRMVTSRGKLTIEPESNSPRQPRAHFLMHSTLEFMQIGSRSRRAPPSGRCTRLRPHENDRATAP